MLTALACSIAGIGFESSVLTYFGSLAQDIHHIVGGDANPHGPLVYVLTGTSLVFCAIAAIVATVFVKCARPRANACLLGLHSSASRPSRLRKHEATPADRCSLWSTEADCA